MFPIEFAREFQVWRYGVSHGQLLLRAPGTSENATRIDVGFMSVEYIQLPTLLPSLRVAMGTPDDLPVGLARAIDLPRLQVFLVTAGDLTGCIVAGSGRWAEDQQGYSAESTIFPGW